MLAFSSGGWRPGGSAWAPGVRLHPTPHSAARGLPGPLRHASRSSGRFLVQTPGFNPDVWPSLPHNFPFPFLFQPSTHQFHNLSWMPFRPTSIPCPWWLGNEAKRVPFLILPPG